MQSLRDGLCNAWPKSGLRTCRSQRDEQSRRAGRRIKSLGVEHGLSGHLDGNIPRCFCMPLTGAGCWPGGTVIATIGREHGGKHQIERISVSHSKTSGSLISFWHHPAFQYTKNINQNRELCCILTVG